MRQWRVQVCALLSQHRNVRGKILLPPRCKKVLDVCMLKTYCSDELAKAVTPHRSVKSNTAMLKTTGDAEAKIIATACAATSVGRARWTISTISLLTHEMALILEEPLRCTTIGRVLRRNNLRHHLSE